ncbi:thermostable hemolysin [Telluria beijingensis]|uniref:thermostable hemolysin n=1 Tax=Telluria beijingensis TaxID=3068633 RepID=UPI0027956D49|nr:thermostable hemolysin [Massilia sp. REN29]
MSLILPPTLSPAARAAGHPSAADHRCFGLALLPPGHPERPSLEAFIASEFARVYGARVHHFCHTLAGQRGADGRWVAALGHTPAAHGPLFLEQYLDRPVEAAIARHAGHAVTRGDVVEVGNLAATDAGAGRGLIVAMTRHLHAQGMVWVTFTATRGLLNSFARLKLAPSVLAEADPARLADGGRGWGSYYATRPQVMFGNIGFGHDHLAR